MNSPNQSGSVFDFLEAVSCTSASFCMAVGDYSGGSDTNGHALIEKWNGRTWLLSAPNISSTHSNYLGGVNCVTSSFCMATGYFFNINQPLSEKWNGSGWRALSSPFSQFTGVSCVSSSLCMAVGFYRNATNFQTRIEKWNGSSWSIVSSPNTSATQDNQLNGVSCTSTSLCMADGSYFNGANNQTLIEKWAG